MKQALIIVDMLNDFCNPEGVLYVGKHVDSVILKIKAKQELFRSKNLPIFYICDSHLDKDLEFKMFPPHAIRGTKGSEVIEELSPIDPMTQLKPENPIERLAKNEIIIPKTRYSGFYDTDLHQQLQLRNVDTLEVVGVCTDICVLHTCADARNRDYPVIVDETSVTSFNMDMHGFALGHMSNILGVSIVK